MVYRRRYRPSSKRTFRKKKRIMKRKSKMIVKRKKYDAPIYVTCQATKQLLNPNNWTGGNTLF